MNQLSLVGSSVNEIYGQIVKEFGWGIERPELIQKMEQVLDRCLESPQQLDQDHVEKIYEILHWAILEQKTCKIHSLVAKAYKVVSLHFPTKDWKSILPEEPDIRIEKANLFYVSQSLLFLGEEVSIQTLMECIRFGRWDILCLLYYTAEIDDRDFFVDVVGKTLAIHYDINKFPEAIDCLKKFFNLIEFDEIWKAKFSWLLGNMTDKVLDKFVEDYPWQRFPYVANVMLFESRLEVCLEKGIPWGSVCDQTLHFYSRLKAHYSNKKEKLQQSNIIELKDWKIGKEIDRRKIISHIAHEKGFCRYFLSKIEYQQDYEEYFTNRHMYKVLKKALLHNRLIND